MTSKARETIAQRSAQTRNQSHTTAEEFVTSWARDTGEPALGSVTDHMRFACQIGYLRGHGRGLLSVAGALLQGAYLAESARVSEESRFAACEFLARWSREMSGVGEAVSEHVSERMGLAYEAGYMRGHGAALRRASCGLC
jgi:hypothetical protein